MPNSTQTPQSKAIAGLIGLGILFMWGCALLFWLDLAGEYATWKKVAGYAGAALVSLCGLAAFLYISNRDRRADALEKQLQATREAQALTRA